MSDLLTTMLHILCGRDKIVASHQTGMHSGIKVIDLIVIKLISDGESEQLLGLDWFFENPVITEKPHGINLLQTYIPEIFGEPSLDVDEGTIISRLNQEMKKWKPEILYQELRKYTFINAPKNDFPYGSVPVGWRKPIHEGLFTASEPIFFASIANHDEDQINNLVDRRMRYGCVAFFESWEDLTLFLLAMA